MGVTIGGNRFRVNKIGRAGTRRPRVPTEIRPQRDSKAQPDGSTESEARRPARSRARTAWGCQRSLAGFDLAWLFALFLSGAVARFFSQPLQRRIYLTGPWG